MLNFMSDHINRHTGYEAVSASYGRLLADPEWENQFKSLPDDFSNEAKVLQILKQKMKEARVAKYLPDFSIMLPRQERIKMRLVLGTHSPQGLELFREIQAKVEPQESEIRYKIKNDASSQGSLFSAAQHATFEAQQKGVGCVRYQHRAEKLILGILKKNKSCKYGEILPRVMEAVAIRKPQVNSLIKAMKERELVSYDLPKRKRVPTPETLISAA